MYCKRSVHSDTGIEIPLEYSRRFRALFTYEYHTLLPLLIYSQHCMNFHHIDTSILSIRYTSITNRHMCTKCIQTYSYEIRNTRIKSFRFRSDCVCVCVCEQVDSHPTNICVSYVFGLSSAKWTVYRMKWEKKNTEHLNAWTSIWNVRAVGLQIRVSLAWQDAGDLLIKRMRFFSYWTKRRRKFGAHKILFHHFDDNLWFFLINMLCAATWLIESVKNIY